MMDKLTANEYHARPKTFKIFIEIKYSLSVDDIISGIKKDREDPYSLLTEYARHLGEQKISTLTLKQRVVTVKN